LVGGEGRRDLRRLWRQLGLVRLAGGSATVGVGAGIVRLALALAVGGRLRVLSLPGFGVCVDGLALGQGRGGLARVGGGWVSRVAAALDDLRGAGASRAVLTGVVDRVGSHAGRLANVRSVARNEQCGSHDVQGFGICVPCRRSGRTSVDRFGAGNAGRLATRCAPM